MRDPVKKSVAALSSVLLATGLSAATIVPGGVQVVVAKDAVPVVTYAAGELTNFLAQVLGAAVPVAAAPSPERVNVILGENEWSRAAGLDPAPLVRDGFITCARGNDVFLLGVDDPKADPAQAIRGRIDVFEFERATLNAVYAFLERHADVRFFFPGELGTVAKRRTVIGIPEGTVRTEPVFTERYYGWWSTAADGWHDGSVPMRTLQITNWLRLRYGSARIQCCHGQRHFHYVRRFAKEHPDWFCLRKDGSRNLRDTEAEPFWRNSKFCYSSPIREEIYQDAKAFLSGRPASSRGLEAWGRNCVAGRQGRYVDVMPEDAMEECFCAKCQAAYDRKDPMYAADLIWRFTAEIGERLIREGVKGDIMMMAYPPYRKMPEFRLPSNVQVMVAEHGPWSAGDPVAMGRQIDEIRRWNEKLGHKVWLWTYPGKYHGRLPGIPEVSPRAYAKFFAAAAPYVIGGYADNDTDRFLFEALNVYAYSRIGWDPYLDIEAVLDDFHAHLFGPAKAEMKRAFDIFEEKWVKGVCTGRTVVTALGPTTLLPSTGQLWQEIYTKGTLNELTALFDAALAKVPGGSLEAKRIGLFRREFLDSLVRQSALADPEAELRRRAASTAVSLVANGDFATAAGWSKSVGWGTAELDFSDKVTGSASAKLVSDKVPHRERNVQSDFCCKVNIVKGRRYRLSYFIKAKDVVPYDPKMGAGLCLWIDRTHYHKHPNPLVHGSCGWMHQEMVFVADATNPESTLQFRLEDSLGTMWIDGVRLEEIP